MTAVAPIAAGHEDGATVELRFLGHATVLLDLPGVRILTDPFLRERLGPLRRHGPLPDQIGRIDVIVVSHAHPDHFDAPSLRAVGGDPLVIIPRGLGGAVRKLGLRAREVRVGETVDVGGAWTIAAVPARHWRWPGRPTAATLGYLVEGQGRRGIYFAGDTAPFRAMHSFADRVDVALLPIGSWGPHLGPGHLSPRSAAEVARDLGASVAIPIHWGTLFPTGLDRFLEHRLNGPAGRFADAAARIAPAVDVRVLEPGGRTTLTA